MVGTATFVNESHDAGVRGSGFLVASSRSGRVLFVELYERFLGFRVECFEFPHDVGVVTRYPGLQGPAVPPRSQGFWKTNKESRQTYHQGEE